MAHTTASSLTLTNALALMSSLMQDESATKPFWSSAQKTLALQYWYQRWYEKFNNRLAQYAGAATFGSWSGSTKHKRTLDQKILTWRHAYLEANGTDFEVGAELEIMVPERLRALQISEATVGTPTRIAFRRVAGITVASSGDSANYWDAFLHPIPTGAVFISAHVRTTPYVPAAGADVFDCSPAEVLIVITLAAIEGMTLEGRDSEFVQDRWATISDEVQAVMRGEMQAKVYAGQVAAGAPAA